MIGKYEEALKYYKEASDGNRIELGNTHPDTLSSISNIGGILEKLGKFDNRSIGPLSILLNTDLWNITIDD